MSEVRIFPYELFVLFPQSAAADLGACADHVREIVARNGGELVSLKKWDERRLAYDIRGNKRGIYFLAYFTAKTTAIVGLERDLNLSERVLRSIIVRVEHMSPEQMRALDGQQQLADEIKLRSSGEVPAAEGTRGEPVEVEAK